MRFKLDENLPTSLRGAFTSQRLEVDSVADEGLAGASDVQLAAACQDEGRVLVTFDLGFADIRAYPPADYPGLIALRLSNQTADHVVRIITRVLLLLETEPLSGNLWLVEDTRIRIRKADGA